MATGTGSFSKIGFAEETVFGVPDASPNFTVMPFTSFNVEYNTTVITTPIIHGDRMQHFARNGNVTVSGDIGSVLLPEVHDGLLKSLLLADDWDGDELKTGLVRTSYTLEKVVGKNDGTFHYYTYNGQVPKALSISVKPDDVVTATWTFVGTSAEEVAEESLDADSYDDAGDDVQPFVHLDGTFSEAGVPLGNFTGIDLTIDNGYEGIPVIGSRYARDVIPRQSTITGVFTATFEDPTIQSKFISQTHTDLTLLLSDGAPNPGQPERTLTIFLPNVHLDSYTAPITDDFVIVQTFTFTALYDSGTGSDIVITRSAAPVTPAAPANTVLPSITGTPTVGSTLTAVTGTWTGAPAPTFTYLWKVDGAAPVGVATNSTFVAEAGDVTVTVTGTNATGAVNATSAPTTVT